MEMKETGIIMSGDHPKLILDGTKTMTRRVIKLACELDNAYDRKWVTFSKQDNRWLYKGRSRITNALETFVLRCPYQVGDRRWMKEAWATENRYNHLKPSEVPQTAKIWYLSDKQYDPFIMGKVRSAMFMCLWMSRAKTEITEVKAERVQEITEADAKAEGANPFLLDKLKGGTKYRMRKTYHHEFYPLIDHADEGEIVVFECPNMGFARLRHTQWKEKQDPVFRIPAKEAFNYVGALEPNYKNGFRILWDSLNAKRGYGSEINPWVYPLTFRLIQMVV